MDPDPTCSTSEIVESEESDLNHNLRIKIRRDEMDDLDQLLKAIDIRTCSRSVGPDLLVRKSKNNCYSDKRVVKLSASESVNLKQALRRLCISQASELAAMKRISKKPDGLINISEPVPGTIRRLYASLVVRSEDEEKMKEKGKVLSKSCIGCMNNKVEPEPDKPDPTEPDQLNQQQSKPGLNPVSLSEKGECSHSSKSSIGDCTSSTSISDESHISGLYGGSTGRPHMSRDIRWTAIRHVAAQHDEALTLDHFKLIKRLGCGDIGTVYLAELNGSGCLFALKVMDVDYLVSRKKMIRAQTEREILEMLDHPFLPTLYSHFTSENLSCLVMEFCPGGDLHVLRQKQPARCFSEPAARFYVAEVLLALEYLHMLGVIYRDLKPENILVREDGHIMLSDFDLSLRCTVNPTLLPSSSHRHDHIAHGSRQSGSCPQSNCLVHPTSCFAPRLSTTTPHSPSIVSKKGKGKPDSHPQLVAEPTDARSNSFVGTHEYLAPEIIRGDGHGSAVDWWTFGVFLYELLYGRTPFKGPDNEETLANVVTCALRFPDNTPGVSWQARDLIRRLLVKDPESRLGSVRGAAEIKRHPFFEGLNWALIRSTAPPETEGGCYVGPIGLGHKKREGGRCLGFGNDGDDVEFGVF